MGLSSRAAGAGGVVVVGALAVALWHWRSRRAKRDADADADRTHGHAHSRTRTRAAAPGPFASVHDVLDDLAAGQAKKKKDKEARAAADKRRSGQHAAAAGGVVAEEDATYAALREQWHKGIDLLAGARYSEALEWWSQTVAAAFALAPGHSFTRRVPPPTTLAQAFGLMQLAATFQHLGRLRAASACGEAVLSYAVSCGAKRVERDANTCMGNVAMVTGRFDDALAFHKRAVALSHELGDSREEGLGRMNVGICEGWCGRYSAALQQHKESLAAALKLGDLRWQAQAHKNLGNVFQALGQTYMAIRHFDSEKKLSRRAGNYRS